MSDYESLQNDYNSYKSSHSHTNDEYNSYGAQQYAAGEANIKENFFSSPTNITTMEHGSGIYSYNLTAPSDGTYLLTSVFSGYAGSGSVSLGAGVTEIVRHSCHSKYGGKGGVTVVAKFKAGQTATVAAACSGNDPDNSIVSYAIWRLSD